MALMTHIAEENISELEDTAIETTENKTQRVKRFFFFKQSKENISCGTTSGDLLYINLSS